MTESQQPFIDLSEAAEACRPLVAWWQEWEATGCGDPTELDSALRQLASCPPLPGRLGQAVAVLDRKALARQPREVLVAALAQLARLVDIRPRPCQLTLPGLDVHAPAEPDSSHDGKERPFSPREPT